MKSLEQLLAIKPYQVLEDNAIYTVIQTWNSKKPERYHKSHHSKESLIKYAQDSYDSAVNQQKELIQRFNELKIGQILTYIVGYDCTLYQFAQVEKKTAKMVILRKYSYQGMSCIAKPEQLTDERIRVSYQKLGRYNEYNPNNVYQNNED